MKWQPMKGDYVRIDGMDVMLTEYSPTRGLWKYENTRSVDYIDEAAFKNGNVELLIPSPFREMDKDITYRVYEDVPPNKLEDTLYFLDGISHKFPEEMFDICIAYKKRE